MDMNVRFQVLGYKDFKRKSDGRAMTVLTAVSGCTPADVGRGQHGAKATDFFLPDDKIGTLTEDCIGQEFLPEYSINGFGKPFLSSYSFKPWK